MALPKYQGSLSGNRSFGQYTGIYRARVENNIDPYRVGRVQVRVPMIHGLADSGGMDIKGLPWASMCAMGAGYDYGSFIVPEIGEYVFVMFEDGDEDKPVYLGSSYGIGTTLPKKYGSKEYSTYWEGEANKNEVPSEAQSEVPDRKVIYKSHKGSILYIDDRDYQEKIYLETLNGQYIELNNSDNRIFIQGLNENSIEIDEEGIKFQISDESKVSINGDAIKAVADSDLGSVEVTLGNNVKWNVDNFTIDASEAFTTKAPDLVFVEKKVKAVSV